MPKVEVLTQEWCDLCREFFNKEPLILQATKGMTLKEWWVATGCPGGVDKLVVWEFEDGFMRRMEMLGEAPSPQEDWRLLKFPFDKKGWWGGYTAVYHAGMDAFDPLGEPEVSKVREDMLHVLSDPRVTLGMPIVEAYKILKKLDGWLLGQARAQRHLGFERPCYVPGSAAPCP